jgi:hypothetical protein
VENIFQRTNIERPSDSKPPESLGSAPRLLSVVGPYNGLANSTRPTPIARNQSDTITPGATSRAELGCSVNIYAPQYAPLRTETLSQPRDDLGSFVTCSVMNAEVDLAPDREFPPRSFNPTGMSRLDPRPVVRSPQQLRLHPALEELDWAGEIDEFKSRRVESPFCC